MTDRHRSAPARSYALFTLAFLALVAGLAVLEQVGLADPVIGYAMVAAPVVIFVVIALACRTMNLGDYFVAGNRVPALFNGLALGGALISGTVFLGLAGALYRLGYDALAIPLGWSGGFVLMAVVTAPAMRASDAWTLPDFLGRHYGSRLVRLVAAILVVGCCFFLLVAEIGLFGKVAATFFGIPFAGALAIGVALLLVMTLAGGMRSVSWTDAAQAIVLLIAFIIPVALVSTRFYGMPVPQLAYGRLLADIATIRAVVATQAPDGPALEVMLTPFTGLGEAHFIALLVCLALGTAAMPHLATRALAAPTAAGARSTVAWSLLFVAIFATTVPAYALFAELGAGGGLAPSPASGSIVAAFSAIANLPFVASALITVGALAAALSTASNTLLAVGNSIGHDVYNLFLNPRAPAMSRLFIARFAAVATAAAASWCALYRVEALPMPIIWSFSLAAAGLFPPIALGIAWKGATWTGALGGMIAGTAVVLGFAALSLGATPADGAPGLVGSFHAASAGVLGAVAAFAVAVAVSIAARRRPAGSAMASSDGTVIEPGIRSSWSAIRSD